LRDGNHLMSRLDIDNADIVLLYSMYTYHFIPLDTYVKVYKNAFCVRVSKITVHIHTGSYTFHVYDCAVAGEVNATMNIL